MNKYIEIISQLRPKNNQTFPIADANDLIGGYMQVANLSELNSINTAKRRKGMLCYVDSEDKIYKYTGSSWKEFTVGGNSSVYNLEYPDVENSSSLQLTEEQYNNMLDNDIIVINNKYTVTAKQIPADPTDDIICTIYAPLIATQIICININQNYLAQSSVKILFDRSYVTDSIGISPFHVMSQVAVSRELQKKQAKFNVGQGLELTDEGTLQCTLDTSVFKIVETLPEQGEPDKIYLINNYSSEHRNTYSEYMWVNAQWELVGTHNSELNLDDYVTKSDLETAFEDFCWQVDLYNSELDIKNKNTGQPLSIGDDIYNTKDFYIVFDGQFYQFITKVMYSKGVISQGNINLQTVAVYLGNNLGIIGIDGITGKFIELRFEYAEDIESDQDVYYVYFTDYDYLTSKDLASVNRQLDTLNFKVNNLPIVPIQKTYYEITEVEQLEDIPEGSVVYFQQYLEGENITYGSFQWIDDVSGFICYTETSNDASTIYSDPNMTYPVYSGQEYKKEIVHEGQIPILYIRTTDGTKIHRCAYSGQYVGPVQYYPGFYIKTSIALKKIASSEDIPVKNSQLENDSKFINTINYKKSSNGEIIIDGNDINVSGEYVVPDIVDGGGEEVQYSGSVNDAVLELFGANEDSHAHIDNLYTNVQAIDEDIQDLQDNKLDKDDIPAPETYILNFTITDGVNTGSYDTTEYANLLAAIKEGKLVIVNGGDTRVTADSQAVADKDAYVVIRYSTPIISDDNTSITISFYELKFGDIDSSGQCKFQSKAIHKQLN